MLTAVAKLHGSIISPKIEKKGPTDTYVMQAFAQLIGQLRIPKAELRCDPEASTRAVRVQLITMCNTANGTGLVPQANAKEAKGALRAGERVRTP